MIKNETIEMFFVFRYKGQSYKFHDIAQREFLFTNKFEKGLKLGLKNYGEDRRALNGFFKIENVFRDSHDLIICDLIKIKIDTNNESLDGKPIWILNLN